jgi:hypothetical protein
MWHKVFTHIHRRMMAQSGGASTCLAGAGGWIDGQGSTTIARSLQCGKREREAIAVEEKVTEEEEGEWGQPDPGPSYL